MEFEEARARSGYFSFLTHAHSDLDLKLGRAVSDVVAHVVGGQGLLVCVFSVLDDT